MRQKQFIDLECTNCKCIFSKSLRAYNQSIKRGTTYFFCSNKCVTESGHLLVKVAEAKLTANRIRKFWNRVDKTPGLGPNGDCWEWTGFLDSGYGIMGNKSRAYQSHRFSWEHHNNKDIPQGLVVMHSCDNRKCVNPGHLSIGTHADNNEDKRLKGRHTRGEESANSKLTDAQVTKIRADWDNGVCRDFKTIAMSTSTQVSTIRSIIYNKSWTHLALTTNPYTFTKREIPEITDKVKAHFLTKVIKDDNGCWTFRGSSNFYINKEGFKPTRISYTIFKGYLAPNDMLITNCSNEDCISPNHLVIADGKEVYKRKAAKGKGNGGERNKSSLLTEDQAKEIITLRRTMTLKDLAAKYGVKEYTIYSVVAGRTWKHLDRETLATLAV